MAQMEMCVLGTAKCRLMSPAKGFTSSAGAEAVFGGRRTVLVALLNFLLLTKTFPLSTWHSMVAVTTQRKLNVYRW